MSKSWLQKEMDEIKSQCWEGLRVEHDCPACFALAAILVNIPDIKSRLGSLEALEKKYSPVPVHVDPTGKSREPPHCPTCSCGLPEEALKSP